MKIMKISDKGLQEILSLGLKKQTSITGIYFLYEWNEVKYLAVPNIDVSLPKEYPNAVKIILTKDQYKFLEGLNALPEKTKTSVLDSEDFDSINGYFENLILLQFDPNKKTFAHKEHYGSNTLLKNFKCNLDKPSPLKILYDTKKPFHGKYHPIADFDKSLNLVQIDTNNLWISAYPLITDNHLVGAIIAFSNKSTLTTDILDDFKEFEKKYLQALGL